MRNRTRERQFGRRQAAVLPGGRVRAVRTVTDNGMGTPLVTLYGKHNMAAGYTAPVLVTGTGYDGTYTVTFAVEGQFELQGGTYSADTAGGTWRLA